MNKTLLAIYTALLASLPSILPAMTMVDQEYNPDLSHGNSGFNVGAMNRIDWAQTLTVGVSGDLTALDVLVVKDAVVVQPLLVDIRRTSGLVPGFDDAGTNVLANASVDANLITTDIPNVLDGLYATFVHVDVPDFPVVAGDILAIVLRSDDGGGNQGSTYSWVGKSAPGYPHGQAFWRYQTLPWEARPNSDGAFRTYVTTVPEPSSVLFFLTCLLAYPARCRRVPLAVPVLSWTQTYNGRFVVEP